MNNERLIKIDRELQFKCKRKRDFYIKAYWSVELYGKGKWIRNYARLPAFIPILAYSNHSGPSFIDEPEQHDINNDAIIYLTFQKSLQEYFKEYTDKRSYVIIHPYIYYRQKRKIEQSIKASGTVFFPVHTLPESNWRIDFDNYCKKIKALPEKFQPVRVCLHMHDIKKKLHEKFLNNEVEVVTAGNTSNSSFPKNLYSILKTAKYVSSNSLGTITFLSIEMGIPFFLYDDMNFSIMNEISKERIEKMEKSHLYQFLFKKLRYENFQEPKIDEDVRYIVLENLGVMNTVSRNKLALILWRQFFIEFFNLKLFKKLYRYYFKKIR